MRVAAGAIILCFIAAPAFASPHHHCQPQPTVFYSVRDVDADAARRLAALPEKATAPAASNQIIYEGDNVETLMSGSGTYAALLMGPNEDRFECDNNSVTLGCSVTGAGDHLRIYAHLRAYLSCRHDYNDDEAVVNLIYRRSYHACGDIQCETWTLLTQ